VTWRGMGVIGAGDVALSGGVVVGVVGRRRRGRRGQPVMWRRQEVAWASLVAGDVASGGGVVGGGGVDEPAPGWPRCGQSPGRSMAAVAAAHGGGGEWWWW
jgi:hypothetical protein